jgi:C4-dicarboxylate-specific signal transduction histidine kinase
MPKGNCARCAAELARVSRQTTMGAMTASIAHEVNQPLAAIVMNAKAGLRWLNRPDPNFGERSSSGLSGTVTGPTR